MRGWEEFKEPPYHGNTSGGEKGTTGGFLPPGWVKDEQRDPPDIQTSRHSDILDTASKPDNTSELVVPVCCALLLVDHVFPWPAVETSVVHGQSWLVRPGDSDQRRAVNGQSSLVRPRESDQRRTVNGQSWLVRPRESDQRRTVNGQFEMVGVAGGKWPVDGLDSEKKNRLKNLKVDFFLCGQNFSFEFLCEKKCKNQT